MHPCIVENGRSGVTGTAVNLKADEKATCWCWAWLGMLGLLALGLGVGSATRLTYHEAFVAQGAREILSSGQWWYPTIGGLPWLEKPPLPFWLVACLGWCTGTVSPGVARVPSVAAAACIIVGVSLLAVRHYGSAIGIVSGAIQATTAWTVLRGRLAEADILLACLIVWTLFAFDRMRARQVPSGNDPRLGAGPDHWQTWRWAFFALLGVTGLVKGTGFGAVLVLSVVMLVVMWDGDRGTRSRLLYPPGWILAAALALAWPVAMIAEHGCKVISLWVMHMSQRMGSRSGHGIFAGETWCQYALHIAGEALPWAPWAVIGAWRSFGRGLRGYRSQRHEPNV